MIIKNFPNTWRNTPKLCSDSRGVFEPKLPDLKLQRVVEKVADGLMFWGWTPVLLREVLPRSRRNYCRLAEIWQASIEIGSWSHLLMLMKVSYMPWFFSQSSAINSMSTQTLELYTVYKTYSQLQHIIVPDLSQMNACIFAWLLKYFWIKSRTEGGFQKT